MRFALLGDHPDGLAIASALVRSGHHQVSAVTAGLLPDVSERLGNPTLVADLEEVLADPVVEAVIVAGPPADRPNLLRRALQSERHVLCVHPADPTPELAYEASMLQRDTGYVLLPLLLDALHPAVVRLAEWLRTPDGPLGALRLVEVEWAGTGPVLLGGGEGAPPSLPGWDVLRRLGGEVAEVNAFTERPEVTVDAPLFLSGRFEQGGQFQESFRPRQPEPRWALTVTGSSGRAELVLSRGWPAPAVLRWVDEAGERHEETWDGWDPWPALVAVFEEAVGQERSAGPEAPVAPPAGPGKVAWLDAVRAQELDDAVRRSVERRRPTPLEYPEATEETGFKGTMTLVGCAVLWGILLLVVLSVWLPALGWLVIPLLFLFLSLQFLLGVARKPLKGEGPRLSGPPADARPPATNGRADGVRPAPEQVQEHRE